MVAACSDRAAPPPPSAALTADVTALAFPDTSLGAGSTLAVHVSNTGRDPSGAIELSATGDFIATGEGTTCLGTQLDPGASCDLGVAFRPAVAGARSGAATVAADPGGAIQIALAGTAVPSMIELAPASYDFGFLPVAGTASTSFHVTNGGTAPADITSIQIIGKNFIEGLGTCTTELAPGASCDIGVTYQPISGGPATGTLTVSADGGDQVSRLAGLSEATLSLGFDGTGTGTVTSSPAGISCNPTCAAAFSSDVLLTAVPAPGSVFVGWSDANCTDITCAVTAISLPKPMTATFDLQ